jgi:hypothetical protein
LKNLLELAALLKPAYCPDWYHVLLSELLQRCAGGDPKVPNLLISTPPGSGKTELIGILFPTYIFSHDRDAHVIALANSDSLATMASGNVCDWCSIRSSKSDGRWHLIRHPQRNGQFTETMVARV